jgi:signal transduction histidine kinase
MESTNVPPDTGLRRVLEASAIETEHQMARLRVGIGVLAIAISPYLVAMELLDLRMAPLPYLAFILGYLIYALLYFFWAPYRRFRLVTVARTAVLIDYAAVTVVLFNSGGLESPFWALWATVALTYVIRFRFGLREGIVMALLFLATVELCRRIDPETTLSILAVLVGVGFSLVVLIAGGILMVRSEREAVRKARTAEYETIHRLVNTIQHAVNNPLAVISGNLQLLKRHQTGEKEQQYISAALEALQGIESAVNRLHELEEERLVVGEGPLSQYSLENWYELRSEPPVEPGSVPGPPAYPGAGSETDRGTESAGSSPTDSLPDDQGNANTT